EEAENVLSLRSTRLIGSTIVAVLGLLGPGALARAAAPCAGAASCPYGAVEVIGQRAEGTMRFPQAVAVGPSGDVYVADAQSHVIQRFSATGQFESEWGQAGTGLGEFGMISGLATDASGDVYVVDAGSGRIEKFDATGTPITQWGSPGSGLGQFDFGAGNLNEPAGGAVAVGGQYVYVADSRNDRIERFGLDGSGAVAFGSLGGGPGQFSHPRGVAATPSGVVVADDDNHRIQVLSADGTFVAQAGAFGTGPGQFEYPYGVGWIRPATCSCSTTTTGGRSS
ncbi:MAG TPA: hypothetical protein VFR49_08140, partial [Solirubrobacteraceae bacterium]|nr:hypothetical protein [Solirubrobacteraceae bacterium]